MWSLAKGEPSYLPPAGNVTKYEVGQRVQGADGRTWRVRNAGGMKSEWWPLLGNGREDPVRKPKLPKMPPPAGRAKAGAPKATGGPKAVRGAAAKAEQRRERPKMSSVIVIDDDDDSPTSSSDEDDDEKEEVEEMMVEEEDGDMPKPAHGSRAGRAEGGQGHGVRLPDSRAPDSRPAASQPRLQPTKGRASHAYIAVSSEEEECDDGSRTGKAPMDGARKAPMDGARKAPMDGARKAPLDAAVGEWVVTEKEGVQLIRSSRASSGYVGVYRWSAHSSPNHPAPRCSSLALPQPSACPCLVPCPPCHLLVVASDPCRHRVRVLPVETATPPSATGTPSGTLTPLWTRRSPTQSTWPACQTAQRQATL